MIQLLVDEGYAYDFLSILFVKKKNNLCSQELFDNYNEQIKSQIGDYIHNSIINSKEYKGCIHINEKIFNMVDSAKCDKVLASDVHNLNFERYLSKLNLQKKWFPESKITEKKN